MGKCGCSGLLENSNRYGVHANRSNDIELIYGDSITPAIVTNIEEGDTLILGADMLTRMKTGYLL